MVRILPINRFVLAGIDILIKKICPERLLESHKKSMIMPGIEPETPRTIVGYITTQPVAL